MISLNKTTLQLEQEGTVDLETIIPVPEGVRRINMLPRSLHRETGRRFNLADPYTSSHACNVYTDAGGSSLVQQEREFQLMYCPSTVCFGNFGRITIDEMGRTVSEIVGYPDWMITQPGGLPLCIWNLILGNIDSSGTLAAVGLTCKLFACLAEQIQSCQKRLIQCGTHTTIYEYTLLRRLLEPDLIQPFVMSPKPAALRLLYSSSYVAAKITQLNAVVDVTQYGECRSMFVIKPTYRDTFILTQRIFRCTTRPGGLPFDIWNLILEQIQDVRAFRCCASTCSILKYQAGQMQARLIDPYQEAYSQGKFLKIIGLRKNVFIVSLANHFLYHVRIPASRLTTFILEFCGKLTALRTLHVSGTSGTLFSLRSIFFKAASRFRGVTELVLEDVCFWSLADCVRLVSAFPGLRNLTMNNVSWRRTQDRGSADESFTRSLCLNEIVIFSYTVPSHTSFLLTNSLLKNIQSLILHPLPIETSLAGVQVSLGPNGSSYWPRAVKIIRADVDVAIPEEWYWDSFGLLDGLLSCQAVCCAFPRQTPCAPDGRPVPILIRKPWCELAFNDTCVQFGEFPSPHPVWPTVDQRSYHPYHQVSAGSSVVRSVPHMERRTLRPAGTTQRSSYVASIANVPRLGDGLTAGRGTLIRRTVQRSNDETAGRDALTSKKRSPKGDPWTLGQQNAGSASYNRRASTRGWVGDDSLSAVESRRVSRGEHQHFIERGTGRTP
ncbi:hypothetical protein OBBRIDRAFT_829567 [Obba rivulosa]|uniref:F-box domain-containing protein n=1 Tax=Obba rivulosa TaxID=1052685 RepID=A0A8E2DEU5_9APHY|nr:hypothetical protein OBBRIDRAFT_829567 [Obba rivulosa]